MFLSFSGILFKVTKQSSTFLSIVNSPALIVALLAVLGMYVVITAKVNSKNAKLTMKIFGILAPINRVFSFYRSQVFNDYHYGKDVQLYAQKPLLEEKFPECIKKPAHF